MIGNAIDRALASTGYSYCHGEGGVVNDTTLGFNNDTNIEDFCDSLKVEMAVTLAFLTGIIMVHVQ